MNLIRATLRALVYIYIHIYEENKLASTVASWIFTVPFDCVLNRFSWVPHLSVFVILRPIGDVNTCE